MKYLLNFHVFRVFRADDLFIFNFKVEITKENIYFTARHNVSRYQQKHFLISLHTHFRIRILSYYDYNSIGTKVYQLLQAFNLYVIGTLCL